MELVSKKVEDLMVGNLVDLQSCPFLKDHPSADSMYGSVAFIERETPECIVIGYEGIDHIGYSVGTVLQVNESPDRPVTVSPVGADGESTWMVCLNLTDRWGNINHHDAENKPLEILEANPEMFESLLSQMWDEATFVIRKDGQFGILFEVEYGSKESEAQFYKGNENDAFYAGLKSQADMLAYLKAQMLPLVEKFPGVLFAVPDETLICNDRPAAWAFVPDGLLSDEQRAELGHAMLAL